MATHTTRKKSWVQKTLNVCGGDTGFRNNYYRHNPAEIDEAIRLNEEP
jgi:hypothetical protein